MAGTLAVPRSYSRSSAAPGSWRRRYKRNGNRCW